MPDGIVHGSATLVLVAATTVALVRFDMLVHGALCCSVIVGQLTGLIVDPDLDVAHRTASERRVEESFGRLFGKVWYWYWLLYARLAKHRGVSHWLLVGTLTRVAWLSPVLMGLWFALGRPDVYLVFAVWFAGLVMSDALHIVMDWVF